MRSADAQPRLRSNPRASRVQLRFTHRCSSLTHSPPPAQATSQWTLDYPPFFALFQLLLSYPARSATIRGNKWRGRLFIIHARDGLGSTRASRLSASSRPLIRWFDPQMLRITADPYQSVMCVVYQRLTVIVSDALLFYAIMRFVRAPSAWTSEAMRTQRQITLVRNRRKPMQRRSASRWIRMSCSLRILFLSSLSSYSASAIRA